MGQAEYAQKSQNCKEPIRLRRITINSRSRSRRHIVSLRSFLPSECYFVLAAEPSTYVFFCACFLLAVRHGLAHMLPARHPRGRSAGLALHLRQILIFLPTLRFVQTTLFLIPATTIAIPPPPFDQQFEDTLQASVPPFFS